MEERIVARQSGPFPGQMRVDGACSHQHSFTMHAWAGSRSAITARLLEQRLPGVIRVLRGHRIVLDTDLAAIYGVTTKRLNEAVKRNSCRFPADFMFRLTRGEAAGLRSQFATSDTATGNRGGRRHLPYAFTEHGAIQAANILRSPRAVKMGIYVVRAFVMLRAALKANTELNQRLDQLEARIEKKLSAHDETIAAVLSAIRGLTALPVPRRRGIGFTADI